MNNIKADPSGRMSYYNGQLVFTVLGGVKLESLEKLSVTLKIEFPESSEPPIRHNIDLYNREKLNKLIMIVAQNFELEFSEINSCFSQLTDQLEIYRLEEIEKQKFGIQIKPLAENERVEAIKDLSAQNLIDKTANDLHAIGVQSTFEHSLILYLAMTSRKCEEPVSVVSISKNQLENNHIINKIASCIPDNDIQEYTQISAGKSYSEGQRGMNRKVLVINELGSNKEILNYILKLQARKRNHNSSMKFGLNSKIQKPNAIIQGGTCIIGCATSDKICEESGILFIPLFLDSNREQELKLMEYQKNQRAGKINHQNEMAIEFKLQNMQKALQPIKIVNHFAPLIELPRELFKPPGTLELFLSFVEAITFFHQYQREHKQFPGSLEVYIETTASDVELAFKLLKETLIRKCDELNSPLRSFYEQLRSNVNKHKLEIFKATDIRKYLKIPPRTLQYYLKELTGYGYIEIIDGKQRTGYVYELCNAITKNQLQQKINEHIVTVIEKIKIAEQKCSLLT